ncbi:1,5-anhydro-D-fructose reductase [bacterium HR23]|nr:1,5-anhydro-D-fructose reductase [bacterium HR23]
MAEQPVRIGIVGAGNNTRVRHIPGFRAIPGVEIISVCNRTRQSSEQVAREFGIPKVYDDWRELVQSPEIDAVCIGTWPYMHCPVTLAALEAGKHVLTEARMAMNAREARMMLDASRRYPHLVTQIVPSPYTFKVDRTVQELLAQGFLGELLALELRSCSPNFVDRESPLHWRQDRTLSGYNTLNMGIWYEAIMRWIGPATKVMAMTKVVVKQRRDGEGLLRAVEVPDHVDILCEFACGAQGHLRFSAVTGLAPRNEVWLFGSEGTLLLDADTMTLYGGRRGDKALRVIPIPPEKAGRWRVEEEFINAIRGKEKVKLTTFEDGVRYMEFTEAVIRSAQTGQAIPLPLPSV